MQRINFKINCKDYTIGNDVDSNLTLLDFIRRRANLRGTKYMCLEGGCGACIVSVIKKPDEVPIAVNSCMVLVLSCHDWNITTIEKVGNKLEGYHPIQTTLARYNGSQCGQCSPGWVMSMYSLLGSTKSLSPLAIEESFSSNVCRCTGYRPILDVFKKFAKVDSAKVPDIQDIEDIKICDKKSRVCEVNCDENDWCVITQKDFEEISKIVLTDGKIWYRVNNVNEVFIIFNTIRDDSYMLVAGNTAKGAYPIEDNPAILIDISEIPELKQSYIDQNLVIGAGYSLTKLLSIFEEVSQMENFKYLESFHKHLKLVANVSIRNIGTIGGNLMIKYQHNEFPSDLFLMFNAVDAQLTINTNSTPIGNIFVSMEQFLKLDMTKKIIINVRLPPLNRDVRVITYKVMPKAQNAHAIVNAGFLYQYNASNNIVQTSRIVYGGLSRMFNRANQTENYLVGKDLFSNNTLQSALKLLQSELVVTSNPPEPSPEYRKQLALALFYKSLLSVCPVNAMDPRFRSAVVRLNETRGISKGQQMYTTNPLLYPLNQPLPKLEALSQCAGEALYTEDGPLFSNEVHAAFVLSTIPKGKIKSIDPSKALNKPGVIAFYQAKDIPGLNSYIPLEDPLNSSNEQVFTSGVISYFNQPVGVIVAETQRKALRAVKDVVISYTDVEHPEINIDETKKDPRRLHLYKKFEAQSKGNDVDVIIKGSNTTHAQYHFTIETLVCISRPVENGFEVYTTSQYIDSVQNMISRALKINQNSIYVQVRRLGGGFGYKISRSAQIAVACTLVSFKLNRTCRFITPLTVNMRAIGKRFASSSDYEVAVNKQGIIQFLNCNLYEDNGFTVNELLAIFAAGSYYNCYDRSRWNYTIFNATTDTAKNTWMRSPGSLEAIATAELIMERIACELSLDPLTVRFNNLDKSTASITKSIFSELCSTSMYYERKSDIEKFNVDNRWKKKGLRFSFIQWLSSGPRYLDVNLTVYHADGSITISHGGVEMGQGINTKVAQICAYMLNIPLSKVNVSSANTLTSPNAAVDGGSITSQYSVLIQEAFKNDIDLQVHVYVGAADQLTYNVYGIALSEVVIDVLTGESQVIRVDLLEDVGQSVNPDIDIGQVEGAFVMGMGLWTTENLVYDKNTGELLTDRTWNYYVPQARDIPQDLRIQFRKNSASAVPVTGAKVVAEPPTCLAISIPFALREAMTSARYDAGVSRNTWFDVDGPYTLEKICMNSCTKISDFKFY